MGCQLMRDMEFGPAAYADVVIETQQPARNRDSLAALLGVRCKEDTQRVLATIAAQAFLHSTPQSRRTKDVGGLLDEPLGDVREEQTLRGLAVHLRMMYYYDVLADKQRRYNEIRKELDRGLRINAGFSSQPTKASWIATARESS